MTNVEAVKTPTSLRAVFEQLTAERTGGTTTKYEPHTQKNT